MCVYMLSEMWVLRVDVVVFVILYTFIFYFFMPWTGMGH
jgi:hypothetical protein